MEETARAAIISTEDLVAPNQVAWIRYYEGRAQVSAKVILDPQTSQVYVSIPTAHRSGTTVKIVNYPDRDTWLQLARDLLYEFRQSVEGRKILSAVALGDTAIKTQ